MVKKRIPDLLKLYYKPDKAMIKKIAPAISILFSVFLTAIIWIPFSPQTAHADDPVSFQDGVSPTTSYDGTRDTYMDAGNPNTNYGTVSPILMDGAPVDFGIIAKWDTSSLAPGTPVTAAAMIFNIEDSSAQTQQVYEMKRNWVETEATWNNFSSGNAWQTAGAQGANDRGAEVGRISATTTGSKGVAFNSTGITLVQSWVDSPSTNYGITMQDYGDTDGTDISSREAGTAANHPKLAIFTSLYPYLQQVTQSSIIVMWETNFSVIGTVEYGLTSSYGSSQTESVAKTIHDVQLTGLQSNTIYHYRVSAGGVTSTDATFRTAPASGSSFSFLAYGDNRGVATGDYVLTHEAVAAAMTSKDPNTIIFNVGDVNFSGASNEWQPQLFLPMRNIFKNNVLYVALGNHEAANPANVIAHFQPPSGAINQFYYSFDHGNTHFIVINTEDNNFINGIGGAGTQLDWLNADLISAAALSATWRIVVVHYSPYTTGSHFGDADLVAFRTNIIPIFEANNVNMVLCGHDHFYERAFKNGVYYLQTGGGGAPLNNPNVTPNAFEEYQKKTLQYCLLDVGTSKITVNAYDTTNNNFDTFVIPRATITSVGPNGSPTSYLRRGSTGQRLGTFHLTSGGTVSAMTITQYGTVNGATGLQNVKLFQDDGDGTYESATDTTQLGATTNFDGTGKASFNGFSLAAGPLTYVHVVADVTLSATAGQTVGVEIFQAADITSTATVTADSFPVQAGTTFIDPSGIVFDSVTGSPIGGAVVTLYYQTGGSYIVARQGIDIGAGEQNPQTVGANGFYQYTVVFPPATNLILSVTAPGYTFPTVKAVPASFPTRTFDDANGAKGQAFAFAGAIQHIDLPMDPQNSLLKITKDANKKEVNIGDIITYTVTITNENVGDINNVYLEDKIPPGFKYVKGRTILNNAAISDPAGNRPLTFNIGTVSAGSTKTLKYQLIVGSGVTFEKYENWVFAKYSDGTAISNTASEVVRVVPDPLFDLGIVIGKVFWDLDEDGVQDGPKHNSPVIFESGVPDVRIVMEDGTVVRTDEDGKYHIPRVMPGRHAFRLDESTLPQGAYLTTPKVAIVDIRPGLTSKVNFGINSQKEIPSRLGSSNDKTLMSRKLPVSIRTETNLPKPRLNAALNSETLKVRDDGNLFEAAIFRVFTNYAMFIDKWQLDIYDKASGKLFKRLDGTKQALNVPIAWDGKGDSGGPVTPGRLYTYSITVWDKNGKSDKTKDRELKVERYQASNANQKDQLEKEVFGDKEKKSDERKLWLAESKVNNLGSQTIKLDGETVVIKGGAFESDIKSIKNSGAAENEMKVKISEGGNPANEVCSLNLPEYADIENYKQDIIVPKGEYDFTVEAKDTAGETQTYTKNIKVKDDYLFFIAMGDSEMGYNFREGNTEPLVKDDHFKNGFWSSGKLAYYLKAKIKGKYLITSSLDTERQQKELFRYIDPDKYYPVYGDNSSVSYDATNTQGMLYAMVEWDRSQAIWGNYEITLDDTEFARFSRTLYGGKAQIISVSNTKFGEPNTKVIVFTAKAKQRAAHNEFIGTGGSLYYLKHKYIIEGSEKVRIEVRDKISGLVIASVDEKEGVDYQIDYDNGRIIFWRPISQISASESIIATNLLDGNRLYLAVDYEYEVKDKYDEWSGGIRASQQLNDYVRVGGTYINDNQQAKQNFSLQGLDTTLRLNKDIKVNAEYAEAKSEEGNNFSSTDGGLTFTELATDQSEKGRAYGMNGEAKLFDDLNLTAYYKKIEKGFSTPFTIFNQGTEKIGGAASLDIGPGTRISLRHDIQKLLEDGNIQSRLQVGAKTTETTTAQIASALTKKIDVTGEYRHQRVANTKDIVAETNKGSDTVAGKVSYKLTERTKVSLTHQESVRGPANRQTTLGAESRVNKYLSVRASEVVGSKGDATTMGAGVNIENRLDLFSDYTIDNNLKGPLGNTLSVGGKAKLDEDAALYNTYSVTNASGGRKAETVALGTQKKFDNGYEVSMGREFARQGTGVTEANTYGVTKDNEGRKISGNFKQQMGNDRGNISNTNIFGLSGDINDRWALDANFERGEVQNLDGTETDRIALSSGASYVYNDRLKASSKLELRFDDANQDSTQIVSYNAVEGKVTKDLTVFGKANVSHTQNTTADAAVADFKEMVTGAAYRPRYLDKLNLIGKYTFLEDQSPSSQDDFKSISHLKAHVFGLEAIYDLTDKVQIAEKGAFKSAEEKVSGFDFTKTETLLLVNRLNYDFIKDWQAAGEYRFLSVLQAKDFKQGALFEVSRRIGDFVRVGAGYNFTDFSDDLTSLDYTVHGPFLRVTGTLYDRTKEEIERSKKREEEEKIKQWAWELVNEEAARPDSKITQELYNYFYLARAAYDKGNLKEARDFYSRIVETGEKMYEEAVEYVRGRVKLENKLKNYDELAKIYYKEGKLLEAKKLWENIIKESSEEAPK